MNRLTDRIANLSSERRALLALRLRAHETAAAGRGGTSEPVAVVGIGCRLPGGIDGPGDFWAALRGGVDSVAEIPPGRWDVERYYDPSPATPGKMNTRWGGFLDEVDEFDAQFFGISPREAESMDPQQRLVLEVSLGGARARRLATDSARGQRAPASSSASVGSDYGAPARRGRDAARIDAYFGTGQRAQRRRRAPRRTSSGCTVRASPSIRPARRRWSPSTSPARACARGEVRMALAGGVNLILLADGRHRRFRKAADAWRPTAAARPSTQRRRLRARRGLRHGRAQAPVGRAGRRRSCTRRDPRQRRSTRTAGAAA